MFRDDFNKNPVVIIQSSQQDYYYRFHQLQDLVVAHSPDTVLENLARIESAVNEQGYFAAGFIAYEAAPAFDPALNTRTDAAGSMPLLWFGLFQERELVSGAEIAAISQGLTYNLDEWRPSISRHAYGEAIDHIQEAIAAGETYQVNFTLRLRAAFRGAALAFFVDLIQAQRPNYAAFIETADFAVCSASPELFFTLDDHTLTSKPMKGTAARGLTQTADKAQSDWLRHSAKNRAENVMIVDMIRNDIGRVAEIGTVTVPELFTVERYPTLWQMTSTVSGQTRASIREILMALFPCASISGAPKVSTMDIIADLEQEPRRLYTGTVGYFGPGRQAQFNVAIRTAVINKQADEAVYGVGGGIVWDSITGDEYEECQVKARILTERRPPFQLLETMLWTPGQGLFLLENHIKRLADSADYFGFPFKMDRVERQLADRLIGLAQTGHKIRLLLDEQGQLIIETIPLENDFYLSQGPLRIGIAMEPVNSGNVFLYHKTTHRIVYEQARALRPDCDEVLLWNEREEITEGTVANVAFNLQGRWVTPPVESGLLAGTYRQYLLERGEIREQVIRLSDLHNVQEISLFNSVQKLRQAEMVDRPALTPFAVPQ